MAGLFIENDLLVELSHLATQRLEQPFPFGRDAKHLACARMGCVADAAQPAVALQTCERGVERARAQDVPVLVSARRFVPLVAMFSEPLRADAVGHVSRAHPGHFSKAVKAWQAPASARCVRRRQEAPGR